MTASPAPRHIYLDTSVIVGALITSAPHATACSQFCDRLIAANSRVYYSRILRVELTQALRRLATTRTNLSAAMRVQYQLDDWGTDAGVRRRWLEFGLRQFDALLAQFAVATELPFTERVWAESVEIMIEHGLQARDAIHVATAQEHGLRDLATVDADFRRVSGLRVWLLRDRGA